MRYGGLGAGLALVAFAGAARHAGANAPDGRFQSASGEVLDTQTGLVWQEASSTTEMSWAEASAHCSAPWRVPSMKELQTLVDDSQLGPATDTTAFGDVSAAAGYDYWSSTPVAGLSSTAWWFVEFEAGHSTYGNANSRCRVRCVR
jgi:hypothetical protein